MRGKGMRIEEARTGHYYQASLMLRLRKRPMPAKKLKFKERDVERQRCADEGHLRGFWARRYPFGPWGPRREHRLECPWGVAALDPRRRSRRCREILPEHR